MSAYADLVRAIGHGFHPDTKGADYAELPPGITPAMVDLIVEAHMATGADAYADANAILGHAGVQAITYAIATEGDLVTTIPGDVLDWLLVLGLDTIREGYSLMDVATAARYLDVLASVNAEVQAHAEEHVDVDGGTR